MPPLAESSQVSMRSDAVTVEPQVSNSEQTLCTRCEAIDFGSIFAKRITRPRGHRMLHLGLIKQSWENSACPLCRLLAYLRGRFTNEVLDTEPNYDLYAFSGVRALIVGFSPLERKIPGLADTVCLGLLPSGASIHNVTVSEFIVKCSPHDIPLDSFGSRLHIRNLRSSSVDFGILRDWYSFCQRHHTRLCSLSNPARIYSLRVIDCENRQVIEAGDDCSYVALSYVWGLPKQNLDVPCGGIIGSIPNVIEDAITTTKRLGLRYLWVDRYCIRQDDEQDKLNQIMHMDVVYKNAEITIVAAAGEDPDYGLPGVGSRRRVPQSNVQTKEHLLISSLPDPRGEIEASKWMERAWTYQEGLLSRRLLVFTNRQVYFECRAMRCCEAIHASTSLLHAKNLEISKTQVKGGVFPTDGLGEYPTDIFHRIQNYSERQLSHSSDTLKGMMGIFHAWMEKFSGGYHYLGVPFAQVWPLNSARDSMHAFLIGLFWKLAKPAERRDGFPSWSWTGWTGIISSNIYWGNWYGNSTDAEVWIEAADSRLLPWPAAEEIAILARDISITNFIHVESWTLPLIFEFLPTGVPFSSISYKQPAGYFAKDGHNVLSSPSRLELTKATDEGSEFHRKLLEDTWHGIVLSSSRYSALLLVLEMVGDHA